MDVKMKSIMSLSLINLCYSLTKTFLKFFRVKTVFINVNINLRINSVSYDDI